MSTIIVTLHREDDYWLEGGDAEVDDLLTRRLSESLTDEPITLTIVRRDGVRADQDFLWLDPDLVATVHPEHYVEPGARAGLGGIADIERQVG